MRTYKIQAKFSHKCGDFTLFEKTIKALNRFQAGAYAREFAAHIWANMDKKERDACKNVRFGTTKHPRTYDILFLRHLGIFI